jgi:hypothetical protein
MERGQHRRIGTVTRGFKLGQKGLNTDSTAGSMGTDRAHSSIGERVGLNRQSIREA